MSVFAAGSRALITGAGSGIGLAIAKLCHSRGMNVILTDLNKESLQAAQSSFSERASSHVLDVSKLDEWQKLRDDVLKDTSIDLLVLNAGRGLRGGFGEDQHNQYFRDTLETNLFGVLNGINTFLPSVKKAAETKAASIVITGSKQGITNPPGNPAYNASKAAVKSLAEGLDYSLRSTNISTHLLVPGWTFTSMTGGVPGREKPAGAWSPDQVADYMYKKMSDGKFYIICPDNDVSEETDKKRMLWTAGDVVYERPPLTRWRDEWKDEAAETMAGMKL